MKRFLLSSIALCTVLVQSSFSQALKNNQVDIPAITSGLEKYAKELGNDFVVIVHKDGKDVYRREFGEMKANTQEPIGAASQWLTAALALSYVEDGKLSLDDKLGDAIPIFQSYSKGYITLRMCLNHTTGIESDPPVFRTALKKKKFPSLEEEVVSFAKDRNLKARQGTQFYYSNVGPNIAGRMIELATKKPFDRAMRDRLGKLLGWRRTNFMSDGMYAENPFSGAKSSAEDYMKFLVMLLNNGKYGDKQVLSEASVNELMKKQTGSASIAYTSPISQGNDYGFGCWIQEKDANGNGTLVNCPGVNGTWPWINRSKGYAAIVFTKSDLPDQKRMVFEEIRELIEQNIN
ncbi:MAG TPA: serine hydrolase domain-containing protein [Flavihumibacter sp.]|jgi:CubicO group peptidase (beta-lactamase class C family)